MRSLILISFFVAAVFAGTCDLCFRSCYIGSCSSATDGCSQCARICSPYGCTSPQCLNVATLDALKLKCTEDCNHKDKCIKTCVGGNKHLFSNHTLVDFNGPRSTCNLCSLPCVSDSDCSFATGTPACTKCTFVQNYGGSGYLCMPPPTEEYVTFDIHPGH